MSLENLIRESAARLDDADVWFGHGTDNALDEAAWLVLHALDLPVDSAPDYGSSVSESKVSAARALITERIEKRVPAAYLTGTAWFCGLRFKSDSRALVPRSPLAELIQDRFEPWYQGAPVSRVLDLCTGSGCIAIAVAHTFAQAQVDATDISSDALSLASENVALHGMGDRVELLQGDVFGPVTGRQYDVIISNPPYVDAEDMAAIPEEYRAEPALGLASGEDGLDITRRILTRAATHLRDNGLLVVEVGASMPAAMEVFSSLPLDWIEFEHGGDGVFSISGNALRAALG